MNSSVVVRADLLHTINGLSENKKLRAAEDYDTWLRIAKLTDKFVKVPHLLGYYWTAGGNMSSSDATAKNLNTLEEHYSDVFFDLGGDSWLNYLRGSSYYQLGSYEMARKNFESIDLPGAPFLIYVKSRFKLMLINFYLRWPQKTGQ